MSVGSSVVVPVLNEEGTLEELHRRLSAVLHDLDSSYEILFVNDGSVDRSRQILDRLADEDPHVGVVHFRRNFGKAAALDAGFRRARGTVVLTLDADLQDDPKEIPRFLAKLEEGYDLVGGWRRVRNDPLAKTWPSRLFNATVARLAGLSLRDVNCGFKAYRREAVAGLSLYGEMHRFVPVILHSRGFRVTEIPVEHHARLSGVSKYGIERLLRGFFDLLTVLLTTRYVSRPLHLFGGFGILVSALGGLILAYLAGLWFLGERPIGTRPLLFFGLLLTTVGIQFVSVGLLGELIVRHRHAQPDDYSVREARPPRVADE